MSYANALRETETFVPAKHREDQLEAPRPNLAAQPRVSHWQGREHNDVLSGRYYIATRVAVEGVAMEWTSGILALYTNSGSPWGDTWSAPCVWRSSVRNVIDVRPALDVLGRFQARNRLRTLRLRVQEKGLQVVP